MKWWVFEYQIGWIILTKKKYNYNKNKEKVKFKALYSHIEYLIEHKVLVLSEHWSH